MNALQKEKKEIPDQRLEENKRKKKIPDQRLEENIGKRKSTIKDWRKTKEKERFPIKDWKKAKENIQKGRWTRQYLNNVQNCHKQERKEKTTMN